MSLSARDRQALGSIQDQINGSDPQLASLMTMFTRLASGEEMPALEDIRAGGPRPRARAAAGRTAARTPCALSRRTRRRLSRQPALYLLWLTVAITLITVTLAINCGGGTDHARNRGRRWGPAPGRCPRTARAPGCRARAEHPASLSPRAPQPGSHLRSMGARKRPMRHLDPARAEPGNLRSATRTTNPGCKPRLFGRNLKLFAPITIFPLV